MNTKELRVLDLFSGIGGFSHGLTGVGEVVAYCDSDPRCRDVLRRNLTSKRDSKCKIYDDVRTLPIDELSLMSPTCITAGFPCQDITCMRPGLGIHGPRSRLFFEIPKLIQRLPSIQHVMLENSPCIKLRGLSYVLRELRKLGFNDIAFGYFSAEEIGALHVRRRWFCLATRCAEQLPQLKTLSTALEYNWRSEPFTRTVTKPNDVELYKNLITRCQMLGNSVVPQVVTLAYKRLTDVMLKSTKIPAQIDGCRESDVIWYNKRLFMKPVMNVAAAKSKLVIRMHDTIGHNYIYHRWATPTFKIWLPYKTLTKRAAGILINQLVYDAKTLCRDANACIANPRFIEHMMGYPKDWTKWY